MTISVLQVASSDPNTSATTTAQPFSSNVTAGSWIVALTVGNFAGTVSSVADTLGNAFTQRQVAQSAAGPGNQKFYCYTAYSASGGADTVTFYYGVSTGTRPAYLLEIGGAAVVAYDGGNNNDQATPTTGSNAVVSGTATNANQPALVIGAHLILFSNPAPASGSGFTGQSAAWGVSAGGLLVQTKRVTSNGSQQSTATAGINSEHLSVMIILDELAAGGGGSNQGMMLRGIG